MASTIITVENIWKEYRYGVINAGSLKEDIGRWWQTNILKKNKAYDDQHNVDDVNWFWALQDVNFTVEQGEVLGIIGKNGAGKSTLLKILSRITKPTKGFIKGKGRIASLLEVGTGFHEELTGKENIFLNGNILGMTNAEIKKSYNDIIEFSGVEKFIDTPVKRYSSGMYVRLAFAVAAHLNPEILIVDEVLAVGDAEFQKKCLGKMHNIAGNQGTTIIFVSHNMQAIQNLCSRALLINNGKITEQGNVAKVISKYSQLANKDVLYRDWNNEKQMPGNEFIKIKKVSITPQLLQQQQSADIRTPLLIEFSFENFQQINLCVGVHLFTIGGDCIFDVSSTPADFLNGNFSGSCLIPGNFLNDGAYYISLIFVKDTSVPLFYFEEIISFEIADFRENFNWYGKWIGHVRPAFPVNIKAE